MRSGSVWRLAEADRNQAGDDARCSGHAGLPHVRELGRGRTRARNGGEAEFTHVPNSSALVGLAFYQQALVLDPLAGNPFGAAMSDAAAAVVGAR